MTTAQPDMETIKARMKATWMAGDFGQFSKFIEAESEKFMSRRNLQPGMRVLDVACGAGHLAITATKASAVVTGIDIATNLVEQAKARAQRENLTIQFEEGDAEQLPYPDAAFDLVCSHFGAMFAPRPERVAAELVRVCRPGGQIAMANWTPQGFAGQMFKATGAHVPSPPGIPPAVLWGDEATVRERLQDGIAQLQMTPRTFVFRYPFSPAETVEFYRLYYGPTQRAFVALPEEKQQLLRQDLETLWAQHNQVADGTTHVEAEFLEVVATRA